MTKEWFIFQNDHHVGPFSDEEIFRMFYEEKIDKHSLLWKKGIETWTYLKEVDELYSILNYGNDDEDEFEEATSQISLDKDKLKQIFTDDIPPDPTSPTADDDNEEDAAHDNDFSDEKTHASFSFDRNRLKLTEDVAQDLKDSEENYFDERGTNPEIEEEEDTPPIFKEEEDDEAQDIPAIPKETELEESPDDYSLEDAGEAVAALLDSEEQVKEDKTVVIKKKENKEEGFQIDPSDLDNLDHSKRRDITDDIAGNRYLLGVRKASMVAAVILICVVPLLFLTGKKERVVFHNVSKRDFIRLEKGVNRKSRKSKKIALAFTNNRSSIWLTTNVKKDAALYLTMASLPGKTLSQDKIVITARADLRNGVAYFKELNLKKGNRIVQGYYSAEVDGFDVSKKNKLLKYLNSKSLFNVKKNSLDKFYFKEKILLSSDIPSQFEVKLKKYRNKIKQKFTRPLQDILERYQTFFAIIDQYNMMFKKHLAKIRFGKDFRRFKKEYSLKIGPILQGMMLDNNKLRVVSVNKNSDGVSNYEKLHRFGKRLGLMVADMYNLVRKKKFLTKASKKKILRLHKNKVNSLNAIAEKKIQQLHKKLEKYEY